ncbi:hypothetical protein NP493_184g01000 [Ridgeia piscesae]|uniref:Uncharacterized protein n=1 Tax=Ridgeia piscesae TaxID=27915 RepID=A0AAD9P2E9_RIDPI|nr:hypothetical protein NP493_184g01000 [Ridgeia piscesae]
MELNTIESINIDTSTVIYKSHCYVSDYTQISPLVIGCRQNYTCFCHEAPIDCGVEDSLRPNIQLSGCFLCSQTHYNEHIKQSKGTPCLH